MVGASLVKKTNRLSPPDRKRSNRALRFRLRSAAAKALPKERVAKCGTQAISQTVDIRNGRHGAHFSGVVTCGSIWTCPVCAAKIAETRREEVARTIFEHLRLGGSVHMATFTVPHHRFQTARELRNLVTGTFSKIFAGAPWKRNKRRVDLVGFVRSLEVTHGANGWHPHIHALFFISAGVPESAIEAFGDFLFDRWSRFIEKDGYGVCNRAVWRFERTAETEKAGDYLVKWGADREITQGHLKLAKGGGRSPWQILDGVAAGKKRDIMLFREYATAFKGARFLTWSRGLREHFGLREPLSDEDASLEDPEEENPRIGRLARHVWTKIVRKGLRAKLLDAVERDPYWQTVVIFLKRHGVDAYEPPPTYGHARPLEESQGFFGPSACEGNARPEYFHRGTGEILGFAASACHATRGAK